MKFKVDGKIFSSSGEAYEYCIENGISIERIEEIEEDYSDENERGVIYDSEEPEENLEESELPDYEDLTPEERAQIIAENWDEVSDETLKKMFLSKLMGESTGKDKVFERPVKISNVVESHVERMLNQLTDANSRVCPFCNQEVQEGKDDKILGKILHARREHKEQLSAFLRVVGHPKEWDSFEVSESKRKYDDAQRDDSESCSKMSKEELSIKIAEDPILRQRLIDEWIKSQRKK
jgi:hypothetical protein